MAFQPSCNLQINVPPRCVAVDIRINVGYADEASQAKRKDTVHQNDANTTERI